MPLSPVLPCVYLMQRRRRPFFPHSAAKSPSPALLLLFWSLGSPQTWDLSLHLLSGVADLLWRKLNSCSPGVSKYMIQKEFRDIHRVCFRSRAPDFTFPVLGWRYSVTFSWSLCSASGGSNKRFVRARVHSLPNSLLIFNSNAFLPPSLSPNICWSLCASEFVLPVNFSTFGDLSRLIYYHFSCMSVLWQILRALLNNWNFINTISAHLFCSIIMALQTS